MRWSLLVLLVPALARAEEAEPCHADGDTVVCARAGFDTLVGKFLDVRAEAEKAAVRITVLEAETKASGDRAALAVAERDLALAELDVLRKKPFPRARMLAAVGLGVLAGLAAAAAPQVQSEVVAGALISVSAVSVAAGVVLVVLE